MPKKDEKTPPKEGRTRNYATIVYPESAPPNWISILEDEHIASFISPLHDKDIENDGENTPKKAHYHVIVKNSTASKGCFCEN